MDAAEHTSNIYIPAGGVMTKEVGVITGDLWVTTVLNADGTAVTVGYVGSPDVHTVVGSPVASRPTHVAIIDELSRDRGIGSGGNAMYRDLTGLDGASL